MTSMTSRRARNRTSNDSLDSTQHSVPRRISSLSSSSSYGSSDDDDDNDVQRRNIPSSCLDATDHSALTLVTVSTSHFDDDDDDDGDHRIVQKAALNYLQSTIERDGSRDHDHHRRHDKVVCRQGSSLSSSSSSSVSVSSNTQRPNQPVSSFNEKIPLFPSDTFTGDSGRGETASGMDRNLKAESVNDGDEDHDSSSDSCDSDTFHDSDDGDDEQSLTLIGDDYDDDNDKHHDTNTIPHCQHDDDQEDKDEENQETESFHMRRKHQNPQLKSQQPQHRPQRLQPQSSLHDSQVSFSSHLTEVIDIPNLSPNSKERCFYSGDELSEFRIEYEFELEGLLPTSTAAGN